MAFLGSLDGGMEKAVAMSRLQEERSRRDFLIGGLSVQRIRNILRELGDGWWENLRRKMKQFNFLFAVRCCFYFELSSFLD